MPLRISATRRFGQFLITKPADVIVDGLPAGTVPWSGSGSVVAADPGKHIVSVGFRYLGRRCGGATLEVDVPADREVALVYRSPWVVTGQGSLNANE